MQNTVLAPGTPQPQFTRAVSVKSSPQASPVINSIPTRSQTVHSSVELSPRAFWGGTPPERDPHPPRAAKQEHFWYLELDSDWEEPDDSDDLYQASPRPHPRLQATVEDEDDLIHDFENLFSPEPSAEDLEFLPLEGEDANSFEHIRHPELRPQTPLSSIADTDESETHEPSSSSYEFLRRASDSPDPLALYLFPTYLSAFDELSLLSFLG